MNDVIICIYFLSQSDNKIWIRNGWDEGRGNWLTDNVWAWISWWLGNWNGWKWDGTKLKGTKGSESSQKQWGEADSAQKSHHTNLTWKWASHLQSLLWNCSFKRFVIRRLHLTTFLTIIDWSSATKVSNFLETFAGKFSLASTSSNYYLKDIEPQI